MTKRQRGLAGSIFAQPREPSANAIAAIEELVSPTAIAYRTLDHDDATSLERQRTSASDARDENAVTDSALRAEPDPLSRDADEPARPSATGVTEQGSVGSKAVVDTSSPARSSPTIDRTVTATAPRIRRSLHAAPRPGDPAIDRLRVERLHRVLLEEIRESPLQPRRYYDPEAMAELTADIRGTGLLQPIIVRTLSDDERSSATSAGRHVRYELAFGHRRLRAFHALALDPDPAVAERHRAIPAFVAPAGELDALEARVLTSMENRQREDLSAYELAQDIVGLRQMLEAHGHRFSDEELTSFYGMRSSGGISEYRVIGEHLTPEAWRDAGVTTAAGEVDWALVRHFGKTELSDVARERDGVQRIKDLRRLAQTVRRRVATREGTRRPRLGRGVIAGAQARYSYEQLRDRGKFIMKLGKPISAKSYTVDEGRKYLRDIEPLVALLAEVAGEKRIAYRPTDPNLPGTYLLLTKAPGAMTPLERADAVAEIERLRAELR